MSVLFKLTSEQKLFKLEGVDMLAPLVAAAAGSVAAAAAQVGLAADQVALAAGQVTLAQTARTGAEAAAASLAPLVPAFTAATRKVAATGVAYSDADSDGRVLTAFDGAGEPVFSAHYAEALAHSAGYDKTGAIYAKRPRHTLFSSTNLTQRANWIFVIYGQSNANAGNSTPALSTTASAFGHLMHPTNINTVTAVTLLPLKETTFESCATSFADSLSNRLYKLDPWRAYAPRIIIINKGAGGTPLSGLVKGTAPYNAIVAQTQNIVNAMPAGSCVVMGMLILHGENDSHNENAGAGLTPQAFSTGWITVRNDLQADIAPITGQTHPIQAFVCVMGGALANETTNPVGNYPTIQGMRLMAEQDANFHTASIGYTLTDQDGQHYDSYGERAIGDITAKIAHSLFHLMIEPPELKVTTAKLIKPRLLKLSLGGWWVPPVEFDELKVMRDKNFGFAIQRAGAAQAIASVWIDNNPADPAIYISSTADLLVGDIVKYALVRGTVVGLGAAGGVRGNVRDSDRSLSFTTDRPGFPNEMYNWLAPFELTIS